MKSKKYNQNDIIIEQSIKAEDNINLMDRILKGNSYIIAGGDINYNINTLNKQVDSNVYSIPRWRYQDKWQ